MGVQACMEHPYDPLGVNQDVAAQLRPVFAGFARFGPRQNHLDVFPNGDWVIETKPASTSHPV